VTGYITFFVGGPLSWESRLQRSVSLNTQQSEYMALAENCKEVVWLRGLLAELGYEQGVTWTFEDNQAAIKLSKNDVNHKKSKHIEVRYHYVRECVQNKLIHLEYLQTKEMLADILTKPLSANRFLYLRSKLLV
jgi:hypothetical protein